MNKGISVNKLADIPQFTRANYSVHVEWSYLEKHFETFPEMELDPPYQRGYVWTQEQQIAYLEYQLRGGISGSDIFWNCTTWDTTMDTPVELVDGKQRISAVLGFLHNKIPAFGRLFKEYEDHKHGLRAHLARFYFHIHSLTDPLEVVQWYIDMNTGGSVHTPKDLEPAFEIRNKLRKERGL
jgi:hypothetical protein